MSATHIVGQSKRVSGLDEEVIVYTRMVEVVDNGCTDIAQGSDRFIGVEALPWFFQLARWTHPIRHQQSIGTAGSTLFHRTQRRRDLHALH